MQDITQDTKAAKVQVDSPKGYIIKCYIDESLRYREELQAVPVDTCMLAVLQRAVQGRIEVSNYLVRDNKPLGAVIVNEEGMINGSMVWYIPVGSALWNIWPSHMTHNNRKCAFGTVCVCGDNGEDFTGLSRSELQFILD